MAFHFMIEVLKISSFTELHIQAYDFYAIHTFDANRVTKIYYQPLYCSILNQKKPRKTQHEFISALISKGENTHSDI